MYGRSTMSLRSLGPGLAVLSAVAVMPVTTWADQTIYMPVLYQTVYVNQAPPVIIPAPAYQPLSAYPGQPTRTVRTTTTTGGTFYRQVPVPGPIIRTSTLHGRYYVQPPLYHTTFNQRHVRPAWVQPVSYGLPTYWR